MCICCITYRYNRSNQWDSWNDWYLIFNPRNNTYDCSQPLCCCSCLVQRVRQCGVRKDAGAGASIEKYLDIQHHSLKIPDHILRPAQNGWHFANAIFKYISLTEKNWAFEFKFRLSLFLRVQLTKKKKKKKISKRQTIMWTSHGQIYWRIYIYIYIHHSASITFGNFDQYFIHIRDFLTRYLKNICL